MCTGLQNAECPRQNEFYAVATEEEKKVHESSGSTTGKLSLEVGNQLLPKTTI